MKSITEKIVSEVEKQLRAYIVKNDNLPLNEDGLKIIAEMAVKSFMKHHELKPTESILSPKKRKLMRAK